MPAIQVRVGRHRIADGKAPDTDADVDDFGRDLMPDDARKLDRQASGLDVLDGQSRAAGKHTRDGFPRPGNGIGHFAHFEWRVWPPENQCFHDVVLTIMPGT